MAWSGCVLTITSLSPAFPPDDELTRDKSEESHEGSVPGADPQDDPQGKQTTIKKQPGAGS